MTRCRWLTFVFLVMVPAPISASDAQWASWRGPGGQGYSDDQKVPLTWSEKQNVLWKTALPGRGNSSPIVFGDRVFLTACSKDGKERYVLCVSAKDGKLLWKETASTGVPPGKTHAWNSYASASCTTDGERVYAFFGTPGLFCYSVDGKLLWTHKFGIFTCGAGWGTAASPFLFEDLVIQNCDNDGPAALPKGTNPAEAAPMNLVAFDKVKGTIRWQTPRNQGRGYGTPRLFTSAAGRTELLLNGPAGLWSYDPRSGKELWYSQRVDKKDQAKFGEPTPVDNGEMVVSISGRPGPFQGVKLGGTGDVTSSNVLWQLRRTGRDVGSPILVGNHFYISDNKAIVTCYDVKTGKAVYAEKMAPDAKVLGSPVYVRGKILFPLDTGETVVLEPGPKYNVTARNILGDNQTLDFAASPAIADGKIYLRSQSHLYCVGQKN